MAQRCRSDDERGATAVEYGILLAAIAAVIIAVVGSLGSEVVALFTSVMDGFRDAG